jgi:hypothetical protein
MQTGDLVIYHFLRGIPELGIILYKHEEIARGYKYFQVLFNNGKSVKIFGNQLSAVE